MARGSWFSTFLDLSEEDLLQEISSFLALELQHSSEYGRRIEHSRVFRVYLWFHLTWHRSQLRLYWPVLVHIPLGAFVGWVPTCSFGGLNLNLNHHFRIFSVVKSVSLSGNLCILLRWTHPDLVIDISILISGEPRVISCLHTPINILSIKLLTLVGRPFRVRRAQSPLFPCSTDLPEQSVSVCVCVCYFYFFSWWLMLNSTEFIP